MVLIRIIALLTSLKHLCVQVCWVLQCGAECWSSGFVANRQTQDASDFPAHCELGADDSQLPVARSTSAVCGQGRGRLAKDNREVLRWYGS